MAVDVIAGPTVDELLEPYRIRKTSPKAMATLAKTLATHFTETRGSLLRAWREEDLTEQQAVLGAVTNGADRFAKQLLKDAAKRTGHDRAALLEQVKGLVEQGKIFDEHVWWPDLAKDLSSESTPVVIWSTVSSVDGAKPKLDEVSWAITHAVPTPYDCGHGDRSECEHRARKAFFWDDGDLVPGSAEWNLQLIEFVDDLVQKSILWHGDRPGRDFAIIPKSEAASKVDELINDIALHNPDSVFISAGDTIYKPKTPALALGFRQHPERAEHISDGIVLKSQGVPTMAAIRAAALNNPLCEKATHLTWCRPNELEVDDERFVAARGARYAERRSDHTYVAPAGEVEAHLIAHHFARSLHAGSAELGRRLESQGDFAAQSPAKYQEQYSDGVLESDVETLRFLAEYAPKSGLRVKAGERVADVSFNGVALAMLPFMPEIEPGVEIDLRDYARVSHEFTKDAIRHRGASSMGVPLGTSSQERVLRWVGGAKYRAQAARLFGQATAVHGPLQELETESYRALFSGWTWGSYELTEGGIHEGVGYLGNALVPGGDLIACITKGKNDNTWESGGQKYYTPRVDAHVVLEAAAGSGLEVVKLHTVELGFRPGAGTLIAHLRKPEHSRERDDRVVRSGH